MKNWRWVFFVNFFLSLRRFRITPSEIKISPQAHFENFFVQQSIIFKGIFLVKLREWGRVGVADSSPLSTSYPFDCEVKWKWKKWKSESIFGPLIFFNLRYIKGGVRGNNNIGIKKCTTIFLWVLNFGEVGEILENFQNHPLGESFWKIFSKVWFWKNFT